jgi:hypothetical protein
MQALVEAAYIIEEPPIELGCTLWDVLAPEVLSLSTHLSTALRSEHRRVDVRLLVKECQDFDATRGVCPKRWLHFVTGRIDCLHHSADLYHQRLRR